MNLPVCGRALIALATCALHVDKIQGENQEVPSHWIKQLSSPKAPEADQAALKIFQDGKESLAGLMSLLDDERLFSGELLYWDRASEMRPQPTVGYVAMYLIHAILRERLYEITVPYLARASASDQIYLGAWLHLRPLPKWALKRSSSFDLRDDDFSIAKAAYRAWWTKRTPGEIENKNPLDGTGLEWR